MAFGEASGWLLTALMMFSAAGTLLSLFLFALRCLIDEGKPILDLVLCFGAVFGSILLDYWFISPILFSVIESFL
jgi:hypothetical protein